MAIPYKVDVPMARLPIANWVLIGLTVIISIKVLVSEKPQAPPHLPRNPAVVTDDSEGPDDAGPPLPLALCRGKDFAVWQLASHVLVHAGVWHLIGNMYFLFLFGNAVNAKLGHAWYVGLYFLFGVIAGLGWLLLGNGSEVVGASGAIAGVVGVFLVYYPRNEVSLLRLGYFEWHLLPEAIAAGWLILFYMVCDLWGLIDEDDGVAYIAHVVGALCGIGIAVALLKAKLVDTPYGEENLLQVFGWEEASARPRRKKKKRRASKSTPSATVYQDGKPKAPEEDVQGWG